MIEEHPSSKIALQEAVKETNDYISETHGKSNMFATLFIGVLDYSTDCFTYINCGHEPPVIRSQHGKQFFLNATGPILGAFSDMEFISKEIEFQPYDILFAYTDGVTEAANEEGALLTRETLLSYLPKSSSPNSIIAQSLQIIESHVGQADQADDITMIALQKTQV